MWKLMNLNKYSSDELIRLQGGKISIANNKKDVIEFVKKSKIESSNSKIYFGKIDILVATKIEKEIGLNVNNYNLSLKSDSVKHILNNHSSKRELLRGQIPIVEKDFQLIPNIVSNYDKVYKSGLTKQGKCVITFEKTIGDKYYLVNNISDKKHTLEVHTMYKRKKKNFATASNAKSLD